MFKDTIYNEKAEFKNKRDSWKEKKFTLDIIYGIDQLSQAFNITDVNPSLVEERIMSLLSPPRDDGKNKMTDYIIFNARSQCFMMVISHPDNLILTYTSGDSIIVILTILGERSEQ